MKISKFLEKIYLFCVESNKNNFFDRAIVLTTIWLLNVIAIESNKNKSFKMLGIIPLLSLICFILLINQYFFRSRKPKLKELMCFILIIIYPIIFYLLMIK